MIYNEEIFEGLEYLMSFPNNYDNTKKYPLLIYLHGAGTRNTNYEWLKRPVIYNTLDEHGLEFIVVAPLCRKEAWFDHFETLIRFVDYISGHENVDPSRVYLTGNSMGGYATWQLAMSIPEYFAAIVPVCGGGMYWDTKRLAEMGVWAFHGALDITVCPEESEKMVNGINKRGGNAKLTIYPDREHDSWTPTYSNPEVYNWLLSYTKKGKVASEDYNDQKAFG